MPPAVQPRLPPQWAEIAVVNSRLRCAGEGLAGLGFIEFQRKTYFEQLFPRLGHRSAVEPVGDIAPDGIGFFGGQRPPFYLQQPFPQLFGQVFHRANRLQNILKRPVKCTAFQKINQLRRRYISAFNLFKIISRNSGIILSPHPNFSLQNIVRLLLFTSFFQGGFILL